MQDHYPKEMLKDYDLVLKYFTSDKILRNKLVDVIKRWRPKHKNNLEILEIGPGFGHSTKILLENFDSNLTLVEIDKDAIERLQKLENTTASNLRFINKDATEYIKKVPKDSFDVITASWVIHNFPSQERDKFLEEIKRALKPNGLFVIFEKVVTDNEKENQRLLDLQLNRLEELDKMGKHEARQEIIKHETRDAKAPYVWYEKDLVKFFKEKGFKTKVVARNERDVVFSAIKPK